MLTISRKFTFDCGHRLGGHIKKCKNLHGHTYHLEVSLKQIPGKCPKIPIAVDGVEPIEKDLLLDFGTVDLIVKKLINDKYDHAFLCNDTDEIDKKLSAVLEANELKVSHFKERTTAENMSKNIFNSLTNLFEPSGVAVSEVVLYETPNSKATYTGEEPIV